MTKLCYNPKKKDGKFTLKFTYNDAKEDDDIVGKLLNVLFVGQNKLDECTL
jgi:hypothetical protein